MTFSAIQIILFDYVVEYFGNPVKHMGFAKLFEKLVLRFSLGIPNAYGNPDELLTLVFPILLL